jgi:hypothetical protein
MVTCYTAAMEHEGTSWECWSIVHTLKASRLYCAANEWSGRTCWTGVSFIWKTGASFSKNFRAREQYRLDVSRTCSRRSMSNERVIRNTLSKKADIVRSSFFPIPAELCIYSPREGCSVHSERCDIAFKIMCVLFITVTCRAQLSLSLSGTYFSYFSISPSGYITSCIHVVTWMRPIKSKVYPTSIRVGCTWDVCKVAGQVFILGSSLNRRIIQSNM